VIVISWPDAPGAEWSSAQDAVFRVHARMVEAESAAAGDGADGGSETPTVRLLVPSSQIGCLIGRAVAFLHLYSYLTVYS
jgi:hypothetical protein